MLVFPCVTSVEVRGTKVDRRRNRKLMRELQSPPMINFRIHLVLLVVLLARDRHSATQNKGDLNDSDEVWSADIK